MHQRQQPDLTGRASRAVATEPLQSAMGPHVGMPRLHRLPPLLVGFLPCLRLHPGRYFVEQLLTDHPRHRPALVRSARAALRLRTLQAVLLGAAIFLQLHGLVVGSLSLLRSDLVQQMPFGAAVRLQLLFPAELFSAELFFLARAWAAPLRR